MPTKQGGLRGSLRNVSTGVSSIPDSGLQNEWTVSDTSGSTVTDSQGTNDWTLNGAVLTADSSYYDGAFAAFDGSDDYGDLSQVPFISVGSAFSLVMGVVVQDTSTTQEIWSQRQSSSDRVSIGINDSGYLTTGLYDGSSFIFDDYYDLSSLGRVGDRVLVTLTWDGSSAGSFYLDDSDTANSGSSAATSTSDGINVGRRASLNQMYFDGQIDLGLAYNRELSASEVSAIYSAWK